MNYIINSVCKLCGNRIYLLDKEMDPHYYHCPTCDLISLDESRYVTPEEERDRYEQHNNNLANEGYVNYLGKFIKAAGIDRLKGVRRALDFGCGPGPVLQVLLERRGIQTDIYDPFFFPEQDFAQYYDLITCTEVLEHCKNPLTTLRLLEGLLEKNGVLAISTLFHTTAGDFNKWWYRRDCTHICFYSPRTFKWLAGNSSFKLEFIDNHSVCVLRKGANRRDTPG